MATRADELADRVTQVNTTLIAFVLDIPDEKWGAPASEGDPRPVGVVAQHVAWGYAYEQRYFQAFAEGSPLPPVASIHSVNAELAQEWEGTPKEQVVAHELRANGQAVAAWVRGLSDEQLQRSGQYTAGGATRTVEDWVGRVMAGHPMNHLEEMKGAVLGREDRG